MESWLVVRLGDHCLKIGSGSTPRGGESVYVDAGVSFIRSQNIFNARFEDGGLAYLCDDDADRLSSVAVHENDVLLNITGDSVARACVVPADVLPARVSQHVAIVRPIQESFDARFLGYYLITPYMQRTMLSLAGSGGTRNALTKEMIEDFRIPRPLLPLQRRIAEVLSAYDDLIENNRRRLVLQEEAARQLYREWFVRLRFPGRELTPFVDGLPAGWARTSLDAVLVLQRGFDLPTQERVPGSVPIYGSTGVCGFHDRARVAGPGIVTGRSGSLGEVVFAPHDFWPLNTALWVKEFKRVTPLFALHLLREMDLKQYNGGASVPTLDRKAVHRAAVVLPESRLMCMFEEAVTPMFSLITNLSEQNEKLRAARDLLLPRLMSGELAV